VAERRCKPLWMLRLSHLVAIRSDPCNLLILRAHNLRSQMLYPAELRARAAILPKFAGGAVRCGVRLAVNGRNCVAAVGIGRHEENRCDPHNRA
jgi:hypothetical protein